MVFNWRNGRRWAKLRNSKDRGRIRAVNWLRDIFFFAQRAKPSAYGAAVLIVAGVTLLGFGWANAVGPRNLGQIYIAAILLVAVTQGTRPALLTALLAFFSFNYFLVEPRLSLKFRPADWLALINFIVTALLVSGLAGRLRDRERAARERLADLTALFEASRHLSATADRDEAALRSGESLERGGRRTAIWTAENDALSLAYASAGAGQDVAAIENVANAFFHGGAPEVARNPAFLMRLHTNERALGVVALWPGENPRDIEIDRTWLRALLELCAIAIDRARLIGEVAETRVVAEREGLRTALLSSLSHDLRTPISTILASATSLQEHERQFDEDTKRELLDTIQDETERLNRYVANLLEMTRLESGALHVRRELIDPGEAMASALERVQRRLGRRRLRRSFQSESMRINVDPVLLEQALSNVIENAVSYTPDGATIDATTRREGGEIVLSVEDDGPGIAPVDLSAVFDKFFRGRSDRRGAVGVGLGLSVTRGLVEAFNGRVSAHSPSRGDHGTRIDVRLPAHPALETVE